MDLPLNGRNPLSLLLLEPGVTQRSSGAAGSGVSVNGSRDRAFNVTIDGIDLRTLRTGSLREQMALVSQEIVLFDQSGERRGRRKFGDRLGLPGVGQQRVEMVLNDSVI